MSTAKVQSVFCRPVFIKFSRVLSLENGLRMSRHSARNSRREERTRLTRAYRERFVPREIDISRGRPPFTRMSDVDATTYTLLSRGRAATVAYGAFSSLVTEKRLRNVRSELSWEREISRCFYFYGSFFSSPRSLPPPSLLRHCVTLHARQSRDRATFPRNCVRTANLACRESRVKRKIPRLIVSAVNLGPRSLSDENLLCTYCDFAHCYFFFLMSTR